METGIAGCDIAVAEGSHLAQWRYKATELEKMPKLIEPISGAKDEWGIGYIFASITDILDFIYENRLKTIKTILSIDYGE